MARRIQGDGEDTWQSAGKVLALNMLVDHMWQGMKNAEEQYQTAFGVDPNDQVSVEGRKNYTPRMGFGQGWCVNLMALLGLDADAVRAAAGAQSQGNDYATDASTGGTTGGKYGG